MTRRRHVVRWGLAWCTVLVVSAAAVALWLLGSPAGLERTRRLTIDRVNALLAGRGTLAAGRISGSVWGGRLAFDSLVLRDAEGRSVMSARRLELEMRVGGMLSRRAPVARILLIAPHVRLEQGRDSVWNVQRIFPRRQGTTPPSRWTVTIDSAEVRDGLVEIAALDTAPRLPLKERRLSELSLRLGPTVAFDASLRGGRTEVRSMRTRSSLPPVALVEASGDVHWSRDTVHLGMPVMRLPGTRARLDGTIVIGKGPPHLDLVARADSLDLRDVAWASTLIPKRGGRGRAVLRIRSEPDAHLTSYRVSELDVTATQSRVEGAFTVVLGRAPVVRELALRFAPLDLALVRELFGDSVPKKSWQGALRGSVTGTGGPLEALRLDAIRLAYEDRRVPGAVAQATLSGVMDVKAKPARLHGFRVALETMDVRTLGAVARAADSLRGTLSGALVLDGPTNDLRFHDLRLAHADGDPLRSVVSGSGRLASDVRTTWMEAELSLDTVALRVLAAGRARVTLRDWIGGRLGVQARRDTMRVDLSLQADSSRVAFTGFSLLDSTRTVVEGTARLSRFDPQSFVPRRNLPAIVLDGEGRVAIARAAADSDAHLELHLDSTSRIAGERVRTGTLHLGADRRGIHVDTADVRTDAWSLRARGSLASSGVAGDTLYFAADIDSLAAARALLLDSLGTSIVDSAGGRVRLQNGIAVGSLDTLHLSADFGAADVRWNGITVRQVSGGLALGGLPSAATGRVHLSADGMSLGGVPATRISLDAHVTDGVRAELRVDARGERDSTLAGRFQATLRRDADSVRVRVASDSLAVQLGASRWRTTRDASLTVRGEALRLDTLRLQSDSGSSIAAWADVSANGAVRGSLDVSRLLVRDLAFTGNVSPELVGVARATVTLDGTRASPRFAVDAAFEEVRFREEPVPSLRAAGFYSDERLTATLRGGSAERDLVRVEAEVPMDLSLRQVRARLLERPLSVRVRADSAPLAGLEALVPQVAQLSGRLDARLDVRGTWSRREITGRMGIRDGGFLLTRTGTVGRALRLDASFAQDTVKIETLRMSDGDNPRDSIFVTGRVFQRDSSWQVALTSGATNFKVLDDPRVGSVDAQWALKVDGLLREPLIGGTITLPSAALNIGQTRQVRRLRTRTDAFEDEVTTGPRFRSLKVQLGNDVRLRSADANVQLAGALELGGDLRNPYLSGEILASRGTYRVNLGVLKRTFRVDSGVVRVAGTLPIVGSLDVWTSYLVRRPQQDDIDVRAHLAGTTDEPRLELSSTTGGVSLAQSEIISYLLFGAPTFALDGQSQTTVKTATAALLPSVGGYLEPLLATIFPFFNSLQVVSTVSDNGPQSLTTNPLDGVLNSFALTGGRRVGSDGYFNVSVGRCGGTRASAAQSSSVWLGLSAEVRPKEGLSAVLSMDPGANPCGTVGRLSAAYQFGLDLFREWKH